jgi:hypothetical protein
MMPGKVVSSVVGWRPCLPVTRSVVASVRSRAPLRLANTGPCRLVQAIFGDGHTEDEEATT